MAEFKREFTQREEPQINADVKAEAFDKGNLYKLQAAGIENYGMIGQDLYSMNEKINNAQKRTVSNKIRINFDTFSKNEQQIMATNPNSYFSNYAENQQRGKKQLEDTFKQINSTGLFNRNEMDDLAIEMQGQYNNYFLQNNVAYARYQKDSAIASTDELMNEYKDLIRSNSDDYAGVNRYLGLMEEMNFGLADFLEPEALLKEQMEFSNYRDTVAGNRIENFLDSSASKLEKDLQRQIANGATLDEIKKGREDYVKMIRDTLSDPNFSLGTVTAQNFESVVNRKFVDPVVNKAFDNAENQVVVNDVFNQVMTLIEKDGQTKNIEEHINSVTLKNLEKLYKEGNIPAEKVMQIKGQVLGKLDEAKASDIMKKMVGKGSPENMIALQKKGAELQLKPHENGLTGYGNVGGAVSAAIQMENALIAQNAQNAAKTVVRTRGGRTGSRSNNSSSSSSPTVTINSNGQIVRQQASIIPNSSTYKGSLYGGIMSSYTQKGAEATMRLMQQNGVINGSRGGTKQSRSAYTMSNNVSKAWNERGSAAISQFMPNLVKDGMITQTNQFAPLLTSNGVINKGTAKAGLELSYTSFTNVATRDSNNNLMFTPKQMYYELVAKSTQKGPNGEKPSGKRFTLFNLDSPEIQELLGMGIGPNEGLSSTDQVAGIKAIHNYFNDPRMLDPEMSDIAIKDTLHLMGYNPLVSELATRSGGTNVIKDEQLLQKVIEYQMSPEQLNELSKEAVNVVGYDKATFESLYNKSFTELVQDDPVSAEFMRNFVADTVSNPENKEILDGLNNVMKGYVLKETMAGNKVDEMAVQEFAKEVMGSFLSDYHVYTDSENKTTFFIDKEDFDPKFNEYMSAYASSIQGDPQALDNFQTLTNNMSESDKDFHIGRHITQTMNNKLRDSGLNALVNSAAPEALTVFTAEDAMVYSQMLGRQVQVGDMLFTIKNADQNSNIPLFITQDEVMESMMSELQENSRFSANWQRATKTPQYNGSYNAYGAMQVDMDAYLRR